MVHLDSHYQPVRCAAAVAVTLACMAFAHATPDEQASREIEALLAHVGSSGCSFYRGDKEYSAAAAQKHLAAKYGIARARIASAEQFIQNVASASSITGEPYLVRCGTTPAERSEAWLQAALKRVRAEK